MSGTSFLGRAINFAPTIGGMRCMASICTSTTNRFTIRASITARNVPIAIRDRASRFTLAIRRKATKVSTHSIVIESRARLRLTAFLIFMGTRVTFFRRYFCFKFCLMFIGFITLYGLIRGAQRDNMMIVVANYQNMIVSSAVTRTRNKINVKMIELIRLRFRGNFTRRTFILNGNSIKFLSTVNGFLSWDRGTIRRRRYRILIGLFFFMDTVSTINVDRRNLFRRYFRVDATIIIMIFPSNFVRVQRVFEDRLFNMIIGRNDRNFCVRLRIPVLMLHARAISPVILNFFNTYLLRILRCRDRTRRIKAMRRQFISRINNIINLFAIDVDFLRNARGVPGSDLAILILFNPFISRAFLILFRFGRFRFLRYLIRASAIFPMIKTKDMFKDVLRTSFEIAIRPFLPRTLLRAARVSAHFISVVRAFRSAVEERMTINTTKVASNRAMVTFIGAICESLNVAFNLRQAIIFTVFDKFILLINMSARGARIANLAQPRPVINFATRLARTLK